MALNIGGSLWFSSRLKNKQLKKDIQEAKGLFGGLKGYVSKSDIFAGIGASASIAFAKAAKDALQFSKEFEKAMLEVRTISQAVQDDYDGIAQKIIDLSQEVPDNAIKLTKAYYQIVSAGYDGAEGMKLLEASSKAAVGGITDTTTAADALTTVLNAWGKEADEATRVSDIMFQTVKLGKTTFGEIAVNISQVAALAASMDVSFEEVSGAIATLTKQGVPTAQAMTQIRSSLISMSEVLGDGWSKSMTYQQGLAKIRQMAGGSETKLREMMGRVEAMNAVLGLTGKNAETAADDFRAMSESIGAADKAFNTMADSLDTRYEVFKNKLQAILSGFGDDMKKGLVNLMENEKVNDELDQLADKKIPFYAKVAGLLPGLSPEQFAPKIVKQMRTADRESKVLFDRFVQTNKGTKEELIGLLDAEIAAIEAQRKKNYALFKEAEGWSKRKKREYKERLEAAEQEQMTIIALQKRYEEYKKSLEKPEKSPASKDQGESNKNTPFDLEAYQKRLDEAKQAYDDFRKVIRAGLIDQVRDQYDVLMQQGRSYLEFLQNQLKAYENNEQAKKEIVIRLSEEKNKTQQQEFHRVARQNAQAMKANLQEIKLEAGQVDTSLDMKGIERSKKRLEDFGKTLSKALTKEQIEQLKAFSYDLADTFGMASRFVGEFDDQLARMLDDMGSMINGFGNLMANLGSNPFGVIMGALEVLTGVMRLLKDPNNDPVERQKRNYEQLQKHIEATNRSLEHQLKLLQQLDGNEWVQGTIDQMAELDKQLAAIESQVRSLDYTASMRTFSGMRSTTLNTSAMTMEDFIRLANAGTGEVWGSNLFGQGSLNGVTNTALGTIVQFDQDSLRALTEQYEQLNEQRQELLVGLQEELTGVTVDSIVDTILSGFEEGKTAAEDFAATFEDLMKKSIINSFKREYLEKQLKGWYEAFYNASQGGLTQDEIDNLQTSYNQIIENAQQGFQALQEATGISFQESLSNQSGLAGAIKGVTEETAGILAGYMGGVRMDVAQLVDLGNRNFEVLSEIAENTRYNRLLQEINDKMSNTVNDLRANGR